MNADGNIGDWRTVRRSIGWCDVTVGWLLRGNVSSRTRGVRRDGDLSTDNDWTSKQHHRGIDDDDMTCTVMSAISQSAALPPLSCITRHQSVAAVSRNHARRRRSSAAVHDAREPQ